jgi:hypothetical protein
LRVAIVSSSSSRGLPASAIRPQCAVSPSAISARNSDGVLAPCDAIS